MNEQTNNTATNTNLTQLPTQQPQLPNQPYTVYPNILDNNVGGQYAFPWQNNTIPNGNQVIASPQPLIYNPPQVYPYSIPAGYPQQPSIAPQPIQPQLYNAPAIPQNANYQNFAPPNIPYVPTPPPQQTPQLPEQPAPDLPQSAVNNGIVAMGGKFVNPGNVQQADYSAIYANAVQEIFTGLFKSMFNAANPAASQQSPMTNEQLYRQTLRGKF